MFLVSSTVATNVKVFSYLASSSAPRPKIFIPDSPAQALELRIQVSTVSAVSPFMTGCTTKVNDGITNPLT